MINIHGSLVSKQKFQGLADTSKGKTRAKMGFYLFLTNFSIKCPLSKTI